MLATCILFFVISGILFWSTDYFIDVLNEKKSDVTIAFGLTSITGPVLGAISSIPLEMYVGFKSDYTLPACFFIAIICYAVAFFIPLYNDLAPVIAHVWFLLFFGGMLLPITNGRILSIVNKRHLPHSQSLCFMCYNLFGWLPAPFLYGYICDLSGEGKTSKWGMIALTQSIILAIILISLAIFGSKCPCCKKNMQDTEDDIANTQESLIQDL